MIVAAIIRPNYKKNVLSRDGAKREFQFSWIFQSLGLSQTQIKANDWSFYFSRWNLNWKDCVLYGKEGSCREIFN